MKYRNEMNYRFYAANNRYGSETSFGFANTWYVLVFDSRKARDDYVSDSPSLAVRPINRSEVTEYAGSEGRPKPFTSEYWGIFPAEYLFFGRGDSHGDRVPPGCIGEIRVDDFYGGFNTE